MSKLFIQIHLVSNLQMNLRILVAVLRRQWVHVQHTTNYQYITIFVPFSCCFSSLIHKCKIGTQRVERRQNLMDFPKKECCRTFYKTGCCWCENYRVRHWSWNGCFPMWSCFCGVRGKMHSLPLNYSNKWPGTMTLIWMNIEYKSVCAWMRFFFSSLG